MPVIAIVILFIVFMAFGVFLTSILTPIIGEENARWVSVYVFMGLIVLIVGLTVFFGPLINLFDRKGRGRNDKRRTKR